MFLVPYLILFLAINHEPSYAKNIVSGRSERDITLEHPEPEILVDNTPKWTTPYHAKGKISLPFAKIDETFEAWYDEDKGFSRIDYQNGKTQTYSFTNDELTFGKTVKILQNDTSEKNNTKTCFGTKGTNKIRTMPQVVLPDLRNYTLQSENYWENKKVENWIYQSEKEDTFTSHAIWLIKKNNVSYPLKYEVIVTNTKFRLDLDAYIISYDYFAIEPIRPYVYSGLENITCRYHNPPRLDHIYSFNPMQEFINTYEDNYYYLKPIFDEFNRRHHNIYTKDSLEYVERKKIFHQNLRYIHLKNRGIAGYTLAINKFADRYSKELIVMFANENLNDDFNQNNIFHYNKNDLTKIPSEFDWIDEGAVTSVKNQTVCSSGWSFAISGAVEGAYFLKHRVLKRFSAQALIDCISRQIRTDCGDGGRIQALHLIKNEGLPTEEVYGLNPSKDGSCHMLHIPNQQLTKITGYQTITNSDVDVLKYALVNYGPIAIYINASPKSFMFYSNGIYYDKECRNSLTDLNHSALLVGYGIMDGIPYWIVKNSWTTEFGSLGYIYISQKENTCGVLTSPTFVVL